MEDSRNGHPCGRARDETQRARPAAGSGHAGDDAAGAAPHGRGLLAAGPDRAGAARGGGRHSPAHDATAPRFFDPERILQVLHAHEIGYVLVGGLAATLHGSPAVTYDVDIAAALARRLHRRACDVSPSPAATTSSSGGPFPSKSAASGSSSPPSLTSFHPRRLRTDPRTSRSCQRSTPSATRLTALGNDERPAPAVRISPYPGKASSVAGSNCC